MLKLLALIQLPWRRKHKLPKDAGYEEQIRYVGIDVDGRQWGLVERATPLDDEFEPDPRGDLPIRSSKAYRLELVRWVPFEAIPVAADERITADSSDWTK